MQSQTSCPELLSQYFRKFTIQKRKPKNIQHHCTKLAAEDAILNSRAQRSWLCNEQPRIKSRRLQSQPQQIGIY